MKKILIIDDEDDIRLSIKTLLESEGYQILDAEGGKKGLSILKKEKVSLVIVDFFMPQMNGRQFIEKVRNDSKIKNQKIILLTVASFGKKGEKKLNELKISLYMQKPFENKDLISQIKKIIGNP